MASYKRKAELKAKEEGGGNEAKRPSKRPRSDKLSLHDSDKVHSASQEIKPTKASRVLEDESSRAFPRGGANILTPLEQKQIQVKAAKDALFEESAPKRPKQGAEDSIMQSDTDGEDVDQGSIHKRSRKKRKANSRGQAEIGDDTPHFRVEGLKPKSLLTGCSVLCQVSRVAAQEVTVDLPNNLTGTLQIMSVSTQLTDRIQAMVDKEERLDEDETLVDTNEGINLREFFYLGQYLRATPVTRDADTGKRKRIDLTTNPQENNGKLRPDALPVYSTVQASVASIEDHGLIMDMGFQDETIRGFMSSKEIPYQFSKADIKVGMVFLCVVTGHSSNGKVVKLSANHNAVGDTRKSNVLSDSPTIDPLLPGTAIELLITRVGASVLAGSVLGSINAGADLVHSGAGTLNVDLETKYKPGAKIKARIIFCLLANETVRLGVSLLDHVLSLSSKKSTNKAKSGKPTDLLKLSSIVETIKVKSVQPGLGVYVDVGVQGIPGFVHISRLADERVDDLIKGSGKYMVGSTHRGRVLGFNAVDGLYLCSLEQSVLDQPFLRVEDVQVGIIVQAQVEKLVIKTNGTTGVVLELAQGLTGFVPEAHLSDVHLAHPEKKFKIGATVNARVLSTDAERRQIHLTLKKSLIEDDSAMWTSYEQIQPLSTSTGTLVKFTPQGAVVHFFNQIRGFLPKKEMSNTFVEDPSRHFRIGQTVKVQALEINPGDSRLLLSCRSTLDADDATQEEFAALRTGLKVAGVITEKSNNDVTVDLKKSQLRATLRIGHLTDGPEAKNASAFKRLRIGQNLDELVVLEKFDKKLAISVSSKPSFLKQHATIGRLDDLSIGQGIDCYVKNITPTAVFVTIAGDFTGLLPRGFIPDEAAKLPEFGMFKDQTLHVRILSIDLAERRFAVTMKETKVTTRAKDTMTNGFSKTISLVKPVDGKSTSLDDFIPGYQTKARISSIKDTQLNVQLADNVQGRIDVSELFDSIDDIKDRKHPLRAFATKQEIDVRVLGIHDARNHRFLPISHRAGKVPVFELSATKTSRNLHSLEHISVGQSYLGFVNNIAESSLWINLSPNVRGRVQLMDISDNPAVLYDLDRSFPVGSAAKVIVKSVDVANGRLDLTIKAASPGQLSSFDDLSIGTSLAGRVTKVTERAVIVQLSASISGHIGLTELADNYEEAEPARYSKNEVLRVSVVDVDKPNKRVSLSTRPSRIASSSLPVKDKLVLSTQQLRVNDLVRGFIKNVVDVGLFISLGPRVTGFVRVSELSDSYIKDWKSEYEVDRLVEGRIIAIEEKSGHVQMSLKKSVLSDDYAPPLTFDDITKGQIVTGKVRKVEEYGAFIVVDNSHNVSGLCHRSEVADHKITDVRKVFSEGDPVKAIVLEIDPHKRRISFGLKASYFENISDEESDEGAGGIELNGSESSDNEDHQSTDEDEKDEEESEDDVPSALGLSTNEKSLLRSGATHTGEVGLDAVGFDWSGTSFMHTSPLLEDLEEKDATKPAPKKRRKAEIKVDHTGDLDRYGPQSTSDFERLLLGQRDSSSLWIQYMAFHLDLGEIDFARKIAERALREISIIEQEQKMNVWVALLNLENAYGTDDSVEEVFRRACEVSDGFEMHERLVSIYIDSGKLEKAHRLLLSMSSNKRFTPALKLWINFASFLFDSLDPPSPHTARDLLPRAMQSVPKHQHRELVTQFALLEFHRRNGDAERGRTMFAQLLDTYPRRWDLWDIYLDIEKSQGATDNVRRIYGDLTSPKQKMKPKRAQAVFKAWLAWEEKNGNAKQIEHVKARAADWVERQKRAREEAAADSSVDEEVEG